MTAEYAIPESATMNQVYAPATQIIDQAEADAYFAEIIAFHLSQCLRHGIERTREEAEEIERRNLAWFSGYYDTLTRARMERLFKCRHPLLRPIADYGRPTAEEAYLIGMKHAQEAARGVE